MDLENGQAADDFAQVQKCLQGGPALLGSLRDRFDGSLRAVLLSRGASPTEADDTLADFWGDCVAEDAGERLGLLEKYSGKSPLQSWLATVATNRWYDAKRKQARGFKIIQADDASALGKLPDQTPAPSEQAIVELLLESLKTAFAACEAESMVLLRLVYIHKLSQREMARMLGWHETKVSRILNQAMQQIENDTLREIKKRDPWLSLTWQDFLDLCQTSQNGLL